MRLSINAQRGIIISTRATKRRLAKLSAKGVRPLSVYEALMLMIAFAALVIKLIKYFDKRK
ncbi:MAG: putative holin-like toxin [Peptococcaceae bacterium]|jgi:hypothetical protein|nr:putative holin-like toxin [Peptococcaceae bacterium]